MEQQQNQINLSQENIQQAAAAGLQLLQTPGAVNVPGPMSITGVMQILHGLLTAIVNKQVIVLNPQPLEDKTPPPQDDEKKPELKKIEGGKKEH